MDKWLVVMMVSLKDNLKVEGKESLLVENWAALTELSSVEMLEKELVALMVDGKEFC
jgi:hypothetical protein